MNSYFGAKNLKFQNKILIPNNFYLFRNVLHIKISWNLLHFLEIR